MSGLRTTEVWEERERTWLRRVLGGEEGGEGDLIFLNWIFSKEFFSAKPQQAAFDEPGNALRFGTRSDA